MRSLEQGLFEHLEHYGVVETNAKNNTNSKADTQPPPKHKTYDENTPMLTYTKHNTLVAREECKNHSLPSIDLFSSQFRNHMNDILNYVNCSFS